MQRSGRMGSHLGIMLAGTLVVAAGGGVGRAQDAAVPGVLAGSWVVDGTAERAMWVVESAFGPGIATLPELFQGFARDRIRSSMQPPSRITIALTGSRVRVTLEATDDTKIIDGTLGGTATTTGVEGDTSVTIGLRGGWLELRYEGEGDMQQLFSTESDGSRMHVDWTIESERLPAPVRYRLDYVHP